MADPPRDWRLHQQYGDLVPRRRPLGAAFVLGALAVLAWCGLCFLACALGFFSSDGCSSATCEKPIDRAVFLGLGGCASAAGPVIVAWVLAAKWTRRRTVVPILVFAGLLAPTAVLLTVRLLARVQY